MARAVWAARSAWGSVGNSELNADSNGSVAGFVAGFMLPPLTAREADTLVTLQLRKTVSIPG